MEFHPFFKFFYECSSRPIKVISKEDVIFVLFCSKSGVDLFWCRGQFSLLKSSKNTVKNTIKHKQLRERNGIRALFEKAIRKKLEILEIYRNHLFKTLETNKLTTSSPEWCVAGLIGFWFFWFFFEKVPIILSDQNLHNFRSGLNEYVFLTRTCM